MKHKGPALCDLHCFLLSFLLLNPCPIAGFTALTNESYHNGIFDAGSIRATVEVACLYFGYLQHNLHRSGLATGRYGNRLAVLFDLGLFWLVQDRTPACPDQCDIFGALCLWNRAISHSEPLNP